MPNLIPFTIHIKLINKLIIRERAIQQSFIYGLCTNCIGSFIFFQMIEFYFIRDLLEEYMEHKKSM